MPGTVLTGREVLQLRMHCNSFRHYRDQAYKRWHACGLQRGHLQQLKHVFPEAIHMEFVAVPQGIRGADTPPPLPPHPVVVLAHMRGRQA